MQKRLLRSLMNVRRAAPITEEFEKVQDAYLKELNAERGIVELDTLTPVRGDLYLWQGDITTLKVGAIVNAANSQMTGCYIPMHICIDNCIHTFAGIQLRNYCQRLMDEQGYEEPTGQAKITPSSLAMMNMTLTSQEKTLKKLLKSLTVYLITQVNKNSTALHRLCNAVFLL